MDQTLLYRKVEYSKYFAKLFVGQRQNCSIMVFHNRIMNKFPESSPKEIVSLWNVIVKKEWLESNNVELKLKKRHERKN